MRRLVILLLLASAAYGRDWRADANGRCPENHPVAGDIGITHLICYGGYCTVNTRDDSGRYVHAFSSEPEIAEIGPGSPAATILRVRDRIIAVDGAPITTADGGRRLANLTIGVPVRITVRRGKDTINSSLVPLAGCAMPSLTVRAAASHPESVATAPPVEFGMDLDCGDCGWRDDHGRRVWRATDFPRVIAVRPGGPADRAGIRADDVLLRVGEFAIIDERAGELLNALTAGQTVTMQVARAGQKITVRVIVGSAK